MLVNEDNSWKCSHIEQNEGRKWEKKDGREEDKKDGRNLHWIAWVEQIGNWKRRLHGEKMLVSGLEIDSKVLITLAK